MAKPNAYESHALQKMAVQSEGWGVTLTGLLS